MFSKSRVWVGFIVLLGMFIRSDVSMVFVMRWLAVWLSSWRGCFESVFYVFGELGPVSFLVVSESSERLSCGYLVFVFECDEDGKVVGVQGFKCLSSEVGSYCVSAVVMSGEVGC